MSFGFGPRQAARRRQLASAVAGYALVISGAALPAEVTVSRASGGTYFDSAAVLQSAANNVARQTYDPATLALQGLFCEPASTNQIRNNTGTGAAVATNVVTAPTDLSNAGWTKGNVTITTNGANDSTGAATLDKIAEKSATGEHYVSNVNCVNGRTYFFSFEARAAERSELYFGGGGFGGQGFTARWNLSTGTISSNTGSHAFMEDLGGGLYRCSVYFTANATTAFQLNLYNGSTGNYAGTTGSGLYVGNFICFGSNATGTAPTNWSSTPPTGIQSYVYATGTTSAGMEYVDRLIVGSVASVSTLDYRFEGNTAVTAASGETWAGGLYHKLQGGTLGGVTSINLLLNEYTSGAALVTGQLSGALANPTTAGSHTQRISWAAALNGGGTTAAVNLFYRLNLAANTPVMLILRHALPQMEKAAAVSSPIRTSSVAVTRAAETITITGLGASAFIDGQSYPLVLTFFDDTTSSSTVAVASGAVTFGPVGLKPIKKIVIGNDPSGWSMDFSDPNNSALMVSPFGVALGLY